ncbi:MAG: hypothetical protein HY711_04875 [Candidatus Melainabacteria bacterium]|nr:hypothetical protein [Candidatus Melainabacteria bacterium]
MFSQPKDLNKAHVSTSDNCAICLRQLPNSGSSASIVYKDNLWIMRHSTETNILGYLVLESCRHFLDLSYCSPAECSSFGHVLSTAIKALRVVLPCERVYTFTLAEQVPHFHVHIIPRTATFPKAYRGRGILSYPLYPAANISLVSEAVARLTCQFRKYSQQNTAQ